MDVNTLAVPDFSLALEQEISQGDTAFCCAIDNQPAILVAPQLILLDVMILDFKNCLQLLDYRQRHWFRFHSRSKLCFLMAYNLKLLFDVFRI